MAESVEQITLKLARATRPGIRGRLIARGAARAFIWKDGILPSDSPPLGLRLTEELLSYGFGLLRLALKAKDLELTIGTIIQAFELAGESLESVVKNGSREDESRGFYRIIAASAYHLSNYSARAYSLLAEGWRDQNVSVMERALGLLILRDLDGLSELILAEISDPSKSDDVVTNRLKSEIADDEFNLDDALALSASENYARALSAFLFAIRTGNRDALGTSLRRLLEGEQVSFESGMVPSWWVYRLTRFLIEGLWKSSLQNLLPIIPEDRSEWGRLRELFVALLASRATSELDLWPSQTAIASRVLDSNDDIIASLPTSAGKTRIAEICILRTLAASQRVVFVTPLRALSAQTERTLRNTFRPLGFSVSSLYGSAGSSGFDIDSLKNRDIVVGTPEKLDFALRNDASLLDDVGLIVLDEGHMLGPNEREVRYEVLIQRLLNRKDAESRRIVCLSAMLPSGEEFDDFVNWLRNDMPGTPIISSWRPTRQRFGEITWDGKRAKYEVHVDKSTTSFLNNFVTYKEKLGPRGGKTIFPNNRNDLAIASAWRLMQEGHSVLIYCPERRSVTAVARRALQAIQNGFITAIPGVNSQSLERAMALGREWLGADHPAVECLAQGIAVHHGLLPKPFLRELDSLIRDKKVPLIVASPTLARGLNISASCVLFQSTERYDRNSARRIPISVEEFGNVAGRAGRAYVDLDGLVLGVCQEPAHLKEWKALVDQQTRRQLESGIVLTCETLLGWLRLKTDGHPDILEYVMNNTRVWEDPLPLISDNDEWRETLSTLDIALLSLIGGEDTNADGVARVLDDVLNSSLFLRRLARRDAQTRRILRAILHSRAKFICSSTTKKQRRGYFFSGIGLSTGKYLDEHGSELTSSLVSANESIRSFDTATCIKSLLAIARIVFEVEPFRVHQLPEMWERITESWLSGVPMNEIQAASEDAAAFVEDGLVYRLAWALEAIRVRSIANEEGFFDDKAGPLLSAVETGTLSVEQSLLLQAGLGSRVAASKVLQDCPGRFENLRDMRMWLRSKPVKLAAAAGDWPTADTHLVWNEFVEAQSSMLNQRWQAREYDIQVIDQQFALQKGQPVLLWQPLRAKECKVFTTEMDLVGLCKRTFKKQAVPWAYGRMKSKKIVTVRYVGPLS